MAMISSPWAVKTLDIYLYYCCPECEYKSKTKPLFVDHAFECHPEAKDTLQYGNMGFEGSKGGIHFYANNQPIEKNIIVNCE